MYTLHHETIASEELKKSVEAILSETKLLSLATVYEDAGVAKSWISAAYFSVNKQFELYILTSPETVHGKNMQHNDSIAVSVFNSQQSSDRKRGVQLFGKGMLVPIEELDEALHSWSERILEDGNQKFVQAYQDGKSYQARMYKLVIEHVKIFDEQIFGEETWIEADVLR